MIFAFAALFVLVFRPLPILILLLVPVFVFENGFRRVDVDGGGATDGELGGSGGGIEEDDDVVVVSVSLLFGFS